MKKNKFSLIFFLIQIINSSIKINNFIKTLATRENIISLLKKSKNIKYLIIHSVLGHTLGKSLNYCFSKITNEKGKPLSECFYFFPTRQLASSLIS